MTKETWHKSGLEIITLPSQIKIAKVSGADHEEANANAQLIAFAPDLLNSLKETIPFLKKVPFLEENIEKYERLIKLIEEIK